MDLLNDARSLITLLSFIAFIGIVFWAWSSRRKQDFNEAANLPFADDDMQNRTIEHDAAEELKHHG